MNKNIPNIIFSSQHVKNFGKYFHKSNFDILVHTFWIETPCLIFPLIPGKITHFDTEPTTEAWRHFALTFCGVPLFNNKMFESFEKKQRSPEILIIFVQKVVHAGSDKAQFCKNEMHTSVLNHDDMFLISWKGQNIWFWQIQITLSACSFSVLIPSITLLCPLCRHCSGTNLLKEL